MKKMISLDKLKDYDGIALSSELIDGLVAETSQQRMRVYWATLGSADGFVDQQVPVERIGHHFYIKPVTFHDRPEFNCQPITKITVMILGKEVACPIDDGLEMPINGDLTISFPDNLACSLTI